MPNLSASSELLPPAWWSDSSKLSKWKVRVPKSVRIVLGEGEGEEESEEEREERIERRRG